MNTTSAVLKGNTFQPDIYNRLLPFLPTDPDSRILDVGAGSGFFCRKMLNEGYRDINACDLPEQVFQVDTVPFHGCDLNQGLPFPDASFDCTVSIEVAEHIENHNRYFEEIFRVLRPGGRALFTTPNIQGLASRAHYLLHGTTDGARRPFDPQRESGEQHLNCLGIQHFQYYVCRHGGQIKEVATNHLRLSSLLLAPVFPFLVLAMKLRGIGKKARKQGEVYRQHCRWTLSGAALFGRILFVIAEKS
ncbi:MAG TPA: class I SAM-dependent methyltransferase [Planctomycetes bacterium]|nr:class I SAM-dependent methyltransferase [Planctomycetota bacterium]HIN81045.1 class I SAM-dependent methyltransferase [Planctomycetota bacterium]